MYMGAVLKNLVVLSPHIKYLKALYLNDANDWLSLMLLCSVLYSTVPLYRSDHLLSHKSLLVGLIG